MFLKLLNYRDDTCFIWKGGITHVAPLLQQIQTAPLDTPVEKRRMITIAGKIIQQHGWRHLFRGLSITIMRAFPVNGIIFPVYEYVLMCVTRLEHD